MAIGEFTQSNPSTETIMAQQRDSALQLQTALTVDPEVRQLVDDMSMLRLGRPANDYENFAGMCQEMQTAFDLRAQPDGTNIERSEVQPIDCSDEVRDRVYAVAERFGLAGDTIPENPYAKLTLILGGRAGSVIDRTSYSKELIKNGYLNTEMIVMMATERPVDEKERQEGGAYAVESGATTEFELMVAAAESVYGHKIAPEDIATFTDPSVMSNRPRIGRVAHMAGSENNPDIFIISSPMITEVFENRGGKIVARPRSNSRDTFRMLPMVAELEPGDRAVAITNAVFRPFQRIDMAGQLAQFGVETEIVGYDQAHYGKPAKQPHDLVMEMLSTAKSLAIAAA